VPSWQHCFNVIDSIRPKIGLDVAVKAKPCYMGPCHNVAQPGIVDGGCSLQMWRVAVNILNKQLWTADKG
jgi:hypothetical protein